MAVPRAQRGDLIYITDVAPVPGVTPGRGKTDLLWQRRDGALWITITGNRGFQEASLLARNVSREADPDLEPDEERALLLATQEYLGGRIDFRPTA